MDWLVPTIFGGFAVAMYVGFLHDTQRWLFNPKRRWAHVKASDKATAAIEEMVSHKKQQRIEDRQKWRTEADEMLYTADEQTMFSLIEQGADPKHVKAEFERNETERLDKRDKLASYNKRVEEERAGQPYVILNSAGSVISRGPTITPPHLVPKPNQPIRNNSIVDHGITRKWEVRWGKFADGQHECQSSDAGDLLVFWDDTIIESYADGHYSTCPYECDCPKWARRIG